MRKPSKTDRRILALASDAGILRVRDVIKQDIHPEYLRRLCEKGMLVKAGHGLYQLPDAEPTAHHSLAQVCKRVPRAVVCLLSALRFHEIGTQSPGAVWIGLGQGIASPHMKWPRVRVARFSGKALTEGIERHKIEGVAVKVYSPAKTVADCFKHRNKIGVDVALEALRDVLRQRRATVDDLWESARICRVRTVMRPYLEALV